MTSRSVGGAVREAAVRLESVGISTGRREARLLLAHVLGVDQTQVLAYPERAVDEAKTAAFKALIDRRIAGAPVSRLIGGREFWSLQFTLSADTLDPRPDSETLIEAALETVADPDRPLRIIDFGTGSGCLLLALLDALPFSTGIGVDRAPGAAAMARRNAAALGLGGRASFLVGDWGRSLAGKADLIVANPPYIPSADIPGLAPEVKDHDPLLALDGGPDGLEAYRSLALDVAALLAERGSAFFEVGAGQAKDVSEILKAAGLETQAVRRDFNGVDRCIVARSARI